MTILCPNNDIPMSRPKRYLIGMVVVSLLGFAGTTTVTVYSIGTLSFVALALFAIVITSIPMLILLWKDITSLRQRGIEWKKSRYAVYTLAIFLPSWVMTPLYLLASTRKIANTPTT